MELTGLGGGIMLAVAAVLWLAYLLPSWLRRREYMATERNAVRLQQTIRVLAETAQVPEVMRVARSTRFPVAVGRPAAPQPAVDPRVLTARRIRRTRGLSTLVLGSALLLGGIQAALMVTTGASAGAWLVLGLSGTFAISSLAVLGRLASRSSKAMPVQRAARRTTLGSAAPAPVAEQPRRASAWTPVPVPKPLYLSKPTAPAVPAHDLERAAKLAEDARRAAETQVATLPARPVAPAEGSRFARMGYLDDPAESTPDLDEVLARRRAAAKVAV